MPKQRHEFYSTGFAGTTGTTAFITRFSSSGELNWSSLFPYVTSFEALELVQDGDALENVYAIGHTNTTVNGDATITQAAPNKIPIVKSFPGAYSQLNNAGQTDLFITRFNTLNQLTWSTFYGGSTNEYDSNQGSSIFLRRKLIDVASDELGRIYIVATTEYDPFFNFNTKFNNSFYNQSVAAGPGLSKKMFLAGFDKQDINFWGSLFGGDNLSAYCNNNNFICLEKNSEFSSAIAVYKTEAVYFAGSTQNEDFPKQCPNITSMEWCQFPLTSNQLFSGTSATISRLDITNVNTGIDVPEKATLNFSVYPNPANNRLTVFSENTIKKIEVTDISGKQIINIALNTKQHELNVSSFSKGVYLLKATDENGSQTTQKFVKQ